MKNPDVLIYVEVRDGLAQFYTQQIPGAGGLPLGTGGRALCLLSGGYDSPVACSWSETRIVRISVKPRGRTPGSLLKHPEIRAERSAGMSARICFGSGISAS